MRIYLYITAILISLCCLVANVVAQEWYPVDVGFQTWDTEFNAIYFTDDKNGWIVGDQGKIIHTSTGISWKDQNSGVTTDLYGVYFIDSLNGWAVGNYGVILRTTDGGQNWQSQQITATEAFYDVEFVTNLRGWIVGSNGTILSTNDGGQTWDSEKYSSDDLYSVHFYSPDNGWAVGENGLILYWNGSKWNKENSGTELNLYGVYAERYDNVWAVGDNGIILHKSGSSWFSISAEGVNIRLQSISFANKQNGWIVGEYGTILSTNDFGSSWRKYSASPVTGHLNGLFVISTEKAWAVGDNGAIIQTVDGGKTWVIAPPFGNLRDVCFAKTNPSKGWIVGDNGIILYTEDGGAKWVEQSSPTLKTLYSVFALDDNNVWAVGEGSVIIRTKNGIDWELVSSSPQGVALRSVYFSDTNNGWVVGDLGNILYWNGSVWASRNWTTTKNLYGVQFIGNSIGYIVGDGGLLIYTKDGGLNWERIPTNTDRLLTNLCFVTADLGWIVGDEGIILKKDKNDIIRQNSGTIVTLYDVDFVNNAEGWVVGANRTLLSTTSGGSNWKIGTIPHARSTIYGVDFTSNNSAIAVGRTGNILRYTANLPPLKFELLSPYGDIHTLTPTFKWKTTRRDITHTIYINKISNPFQPPLLYVIPVVYDTSYTLPKEIQLSPGTYYWGIEAAGIRSKPDEILRFNAWSSKDIVLVSPVGYIKDTKPKFEWHWIENVSYMIYIDTDPNPFDGQGFDVGRSTTYTISDIDPWKSLPEGIYSWGIVGNDDGKLTKSSVMNFVIDLSPPTGKIEINNGDKATNSPTVTLKLSASDLIAGGKASGVGVVQFRLSNDGSTWTTPETFTPDTMTKTWDLRLFGGNDTDGLKTVFVQYKDALDHWSDSIKASIFLDRTPPTGTVVINNGDEVTASFEVTLTLSATDTGVGMDGGIMIISNDASTWSEQLPYETTRRWDLRYIGGNENDGVKTVYVQYRDPAGNWTTQSITDTIRLDRTGPRGTVTINNGAGETNSLIVTLTLSATDESGVKEMMFSNGGEIWSQPEPYKTTRENWDLSQYGGNNKDGLKKVFVRFIDNVGNQSKPAIEGSINFKSKVSISSLIISSPKAVGKVKNGDTVQVSGKTEPNIEIVSKTLIDENGKPIDLDLSGITYDKATGLIGGSFTLGVLTAKTIQLKIVVKDMLGNQAEGLSENTLIVDNTPPSNISISLEPKGITNQKNITVNLTATDAKEMFVSGDVSTVYEVDNGLRNWIPFRNVLKIRVTDGDGNKIVKVKFRDDLGNESDEVSSSVTLDSTPPQGTILINNGEDASASLIVNLKLTATDPSGVVSYQLSNDGQTWSQEFVYPKDAQSYDVKSWDLRLFGGTSDDGLRNVYVRFKDAPGNWSGPVSDSINIDATPPSISIQLIGNNREAMKPVVVTAIIRDNVSVKEAYLYYRKKGTSEYTVVPMIKLTGDYYTAEIPGTQVTLEGIEYYLLASDGNLTSTHPIKDAPLSPNYFTVVDTTPPNIDHDPITEIPVKTSPLIEAKITDAVGIDRVNLYYKVQADKSYIKVEMKADTSNLTSRVYSANIPAFDKPIIVEYYIEAFDVSSNIRTAPANGSRQPYVLMFVDTDPPVISHTPIPDGQEAGNPVLIGATIIDNVGVENVIFKYSPPGKSEFIEVKMTKVGDYYSVEIPGNILMPGTVQYSIRAYDASPQSPDAEVKYSFTVVDTTPPLIEVTSAPSREEVNKDISVQVKVTDNVKVDIVTLYYKGVTDTKFTSVVMKVSGNRYSAGIPAQKRTGEVRYYFHAKDTQGNSITSPSVDPENASYKIEIFDSSAPIIKHTPIMTTQEAGLAVTITATVTDDVQVMDVAIHYRQAGQESFKIAPMIETATKSLYSGTIPANQVAPTGIEYYIKAMDNSGNMTTYPAINPDKVPLSFRVADTLPPEINYDPSKLAKLVITDPITVVTEVTDRTGIKEVNVFYRFEGAKDFILLSCRDLGNNRYSVTIPSPLETGNVYYYIQAEDNSGNKITSPKIDPTKQPYIAYVYDPFPPLPPTRLIAIPMPGGKVKLTWEKSPSIDVFRYNIYTDNGSGTIDYSKIFDFVDANRNSWDSSSLGEGIYKFSVRAIDRSGNEETNTVIVIVEADSVKPERPTDVKATAISGGRIELTWRLSTSRDATVYNIYWDNSQANIDYSSPIARVNDPGTKWVSDKLRDGIIYRFVVRCQDKAGNEDDNTNVVSARADAGPPSAVTNLTSSTHKIDVWSNQPKVSVSWSPSIDVISGLDGYSISWDVGERTLPDEVKDIGDINQLTYDATDLLKTGTARIYFHIRPVDKVGNWSESASHLGPFLIDIQAPQPPSNLIAISQPGGKIKLNWKASESNDVSKYNIYWDNSTGSVDYSKPLATIAGTGSASYEWTSSALTNGKTYNFVVRAEDQATNEEKNSKIVSAIADDQPPTIIHKPIQALLEQEIMSVDITATVDDSGGVDLVKLYYRKHGDSKYMETEMSKEPANVYRGQIPSSILSSVGIDYYISATDKAGNIASNTVTTISVVRSLQMPIDPTKESEILLGDGSSVYLPAGAVPSGTNINITIPSIVPDPQAGLKRHIISREFSLDKDLLKPINVTLRYSDAKIIGEDESKLAMYLWDGQRWNHLANVNAKDNSATIATMKTGIFSIIGDYDPPVIKDFSPKGYAEPDSLIIAKVEENGSGIDIKKIEVILNGAKIDVPDSAFKDNVLSLAPPKKFDLGHYSLQISVKDKVGNQASVSSTFDVTGKLTMINVYCYPNPFDPKIGANFAYTLTESADTVTIRIFGMDGRLVKKIDGTTNLGENIVKWDCIDEAGEQILNSVYICQIEAKSPKVTVVQTIRIAGWE